MNAEMSTVTTPLLDVSLATLGQGTPLLYLHDVHFDLVDADGQPPRIVELLAEAHTVYAPALPGFRDLKELAAVDNVADYVTVITDLLDTLNFEHIHIVGTGLGGWIAAEIAVQHPHRPRTLTLINAFGLRVEDHPIARFFDAGAPNPLGGRREIRELLFADPDNEPGITALPDFPDDHTNQQYFTHMHAAARIGWSPPAFYNPKLHTRLHRITAPTHIIWATNNTLVDTAHAHAYHTGILNSTLTTIDHTAHAITLEQPDHLTKTITTYTEQHNS